MRLGSLVLVFVACAGTGAPPATTPAPAPTGPATPTPAPPAPPPAAPVAATKLDLTPGTHLVVVRDGVYTVVGVFEQDGKPMLRLKQDDHSYWIETDKLDGNVRALVSADEAERRLAVLRDPTPDVDERPSQPRYTDRQRAIRRGTDDQQVAMLRSLYASPFEMSYGERLDLEQLETSLVGELEVVLGRTPGTLVTELHAIHADVGAFRATPRKRKPDPPPPPLPRDPFGYGEHEYHGSFAVQSGTLVLGDPIYTHAWHDEPADVEVRKNLLVPARNGRWHCYVELDPAHHDEPVLAMLLVHDAIARAPDDARAATTVPGKLWVDSGQMAALDAAIRDDQAFDDAIHLGADVGGITADRGCKYQSGGGDGTYPAHVHTVDGAADLIVIDFAGESRDFVIDARKRLRLPARRR
jgi:RNA polymerase-interacting CarD/CdnL/TRCF family regulator